MATPKPESAVADAASVLAWDVSLSVADGGGRRVQALIEALVELQVELTCIGLGPRSPGETSYGPTAVGSAAVSRVVDRKILRRAKQYFLPVPLRSPVERQLFGATVAKNVVSTLLPAHRWALGAGERVWLDYPDLWSSYVKSFQSPVNAPSTFMQSRLWRLREMSESREAAIVTTASWDDAEHLGGKARWLPTPVGRAESFGFRRRPSEQPVFGLLANFNYRPNRQAYEVLVSSWLPKLRSIGSVIVAGFGARSLPERAGLVNLGELDGLDQFYDRIDCALCPVETGGGMKVKIVEAIAAGRPVVTTRHGLEGLPPGLAGACTLIDDIGSEANFSNPLENERVRKAMLMYSNEHFKDVVKELWGLD